MRYLKSFVVTMMLSVASSAFAADHPELSELAPLVGQRIESDAVKALVKKYDLRHSQKFDEGSFTARDQAYTLMIRRDRIESIILRASPYPKGYGEANWTTYAHALPRDLKASDSRKEVERKLGKPTQRGGDRWVDDQMQLWVHFAARDASIDEVWVSAPPKPGK